MIWLLGFDHQLNFFHRPECLSCGTALVLIVPIPKHVKFKHEVSVCQILSLNEPLLKILAVEIRILCELHSAGFLLTAGRLGMLVMLVTGHCLKQQGICVISQLDTLILLNIGFFMRGHRSLITSGGLDIYGGVFFT